MTRQEAINSIAKNAPYTMFQLINQIYNDFENRRCSNCKHWTYATMECDIVKSIRPNEPFACNQWKGK